ncbi:LysM peptidoglycan-binding domain-containing protein [Mycobacterium decipiens]|uniref:LysM domain-containing protein n=1 Tax=Mycobacterium decipiens TaxID=1430326 RepID=A0A1X2LYB4_9MYCO|nr:LysM peptidoglycan-binding domain-containing protein [Mycobacterium decipiens]OSC42218.1 hypothetical protein B8W66_04295 [Mycobacterium decipiens]
MTLFQAGPPRTANPPSLRVRVDGPGRRRADLTQSRRPGRSRPAGAPLRYRGIGVGLSIAGHRRRPVTPATTVGLALLAAVITVWLGLVAQFGEMINGGSSEWSAGSPAGVPYRLAVVRVEPGESLQDVAARVAPNAPARQVADRIRELNALVSPAVAAGQTLIAPVG